MGPRLLSIVLLLVLAAGAAAELTAQGPRRSGPAPPALLVGVYGGWDTFFREPLVGAKVRVAVPRFDFLALQATGDLTFLSAITERQATVDLLLTGGGFALGGGPVFRNTVWDLSGNPRETRTGWSAVISFGGVPFGRAPFAVGIDYRFVRVGGFRPSPLTLSVTVAPGRLLP